MTHPILRADQWTHLSPTARAEVRLHALPMVWLRVGPGSTLCGLKLEMGHSESVADFAIRVHATGTWHEHLARCVACRKVAIDSDHCLIDGMQPDPDALIPGWNAPLPEIVAPLNLDATPPKNKAPRSKGLSAKGRTRALAEAGKLSADDLRRLLDEATAKETR